MKVHVGSLKNLRETEADFIKQEIHLVETGYQEKDVKRIRIAQIRLQRMYHALTPEAQEKADKILRKIESAISELEGNKDGKNN